MADLEGRVHRLELSVVEIREKMAAMTTEQRHILDTVQRIEGSVAAVKKSVDDMPTIAKALHDPKVVLMLFAMFGGAAGVDTVIGNLMASAPVAEAAP
tara:strand:- start:1502 stop:1795 length:294 start_codon:yes stop_codon:yes gene_type:complete